MYIEYSESFRYHAKKSVFAIILFFITYFLLVLLGIAIAIAMTFLGIQLIKIFGGNFITLITTLGLAASGVTLVVFLFKFIFLKSVSNTEGFREITKSQHPELFKVIEELAKEVGTDVPKKVFITDQVNASVFYDSSFWSMIFPVRKNLMIGYALVNASTKDELKGILAHEFGHFSQKSMKVGSYVYNCNRVIYNLVYENNSFEAAIERYGNSHFILKITFLLAVFIVRGFQWILKKMYEFLNVSYLSLSREMEFHADAVATHIVGSDTMIDSLLRMDLADKSYNSVIEFVNEQYAEKKKISNLFSLQKDVLQFFGELNNLEFKGRYPLVRIEEIDQYQKSRLIIKDQWASHPTTEERVKKIKALNIKKENPNIVEANVLFDNTTILEEKLTDLFYNDLEESSLDQINLNEVFNAYKAYYKTVTFNKEYNGYYNYKNPILEPSQISEIYPLLTFEELFSDEIMELVNSYNALSSDFNDLKFLTVEDHVIKTFDFEGVKYKKNQAGHLLEGLNKEKEVLEAKIQVHDEKIYHYFLEQAKINDVLPKWQKLYDIYVYCDKLYDLGFEETQKLEKKLEFLQQDLNLDVIYKHLKDLKNTEEVYKKHLKVLEKLPLYQEVINDDLKEIVTAYINHNDLYIKGNTWNDDSLNTLFSCLRLLPHIHSRLMFVSKKQLLDFQIDMIKIPV